MTASDMVNPPWVVVASSYRSASVPLHQLAQRRAQILAGVLEMRMDLERPSEQGRGLAELAERDVAQPLAGQGAEVIRIPRERLHAVRDRAFVVARHVPEGGALVPGLRKIRGLR